MSPLRRNMVIVGDSGAGKTALIRYMAEGSYAGTNFQPSFYGGHVNVIISDETEVLLLFWDTAGGEEHHHRRSAAYRYSALIVICFDVDSPKSFRNVTQRWYPEMLHFCSTPKVPMLLVGCKTDLRDVGEEGKRSTRVKSEQGHAMATNIGAVEYLECSALLGHGVREVMLSAARIAASWDPLSQDVRPGCKIV